MAKRGDRKTRHLTPEQPKPNQTRRQRARAEQGALFYGEAHVEIRNLPSPEELARYGEVVPGMPDALVDAFLQQGEHRRDLERRVVNNQIIQGYIGQGFAGAIGLIVVYFSGRAIMAGHQVGGFGGVLIALGSLVGIYVVGRRAQNEDLRAKRDNRR